MKTKECSVTLKELINDMYLCIFDNKCDVDELMKHVVRALDFFKTCCAIELSPEEKLSITGGKQLTHSKSLSVIFNDEVVKPSEELMKCSTVSKIISCINDAVTEYLKKHSAKNLYMNCHNYYSSLMAYSSGMSYNFSRLEKLLTIMNDLISYNLTLHTSFNWAVTSFLFHILYVNTTSIIIHHHNMSLSMQISDKTDNVSSLARLFEAKRYFINNFMIDILPKILSFNVNIRDNQIMFYQTPLDVADANPILRLIFDYNNSTLTPDTVKHFLINHGHNLIQIVNSPVIAGSKTDSLITATKSLSSLTATPSAPPAPVSKQKPEMSRMPSDRDYKKIIMMKFFSLLEKCAIAYRDKKAPASSMVVNVFEGTRQISIKDGQVIVKS